MTEQTTITTGEHSDADRDTESIHGRLDPPRVNHGTLILSGWVFGQDTVVEQVEICDQRGPIGHAPVNRPRPDVVEALGAGVPAKTGFEARLRPERGSGTSTLSVAVLSSGERAKLGFVEVSVERKPRRRPWRRRSRSDRDEIEWRLELRAAELEKALIGDSGWLFLIGDTNDVIGQHTGAVRLGRRGRSGWKRVLGSRVADAASLGAIWHCQVAPDKEAVYSEFLPASIALSRKRPIHEFLDAAASARAPVHYPLDELRAAKAEMPVYQQVDTHWTGWGAYVAYHSICEALRGRGLEGLALDEGSIRWREVTSGGDLGDKLRPARTGKAVVAHIDPPIGRVVFNNRIENHGRVVIFEDDRPGLACVAFGESFALLQLPFLGASFRRLVFVHTSMWLRKVVEMERPDVVLSLPLERFLIQVPSDGGIEGLRETIDWKSRERMFTERDRFLQQAPGVEEADDGARTGRLPAEWTPN